MNVKIIKHESIDDVIPEYIDFKLNNKTLVFIFKKTLLAIVIMS